MDARHVLASVMLTSTFLVAGCGTVVSGSGAVATPTVSPDAGLQAAAVKAATVLAARGHAKPVAAAFVVTTVQGLTTLVDNTDSFSRFDPTDQMVVVRLYGSFTPDHSRPLGAPLQPAGVMTTVYDATLGVTVMNSFDGSPMNSAQAGTGDAALKQLGTPISIDVTAITP